MTLGSVVPWGRSFEEYERMFLLNEADLAGRILDAGGGPAAFAAEAFHRGHKVVACDPLYRYGSVQIARRIGEVYPRVMELLESRRETYLWEEFREPREVGAVRMEAMEEFLADFPEGKRQGRYLADALPRLPFPDSRFDLALCSHLLFTYSDQLGEAFHEEAVRELMRVAWEVRIFPLLTVEGEPSPLLASMKERIEREGMAWEEVAVPYRFQRGATAMLRIFHP